MLLYLYLMFFTWFCCHLSMFLIHIYFSTWSLSFPWAIARFTPNLYFQPSPTQSDSRHFHFQPFQDLLTASATVLSWRFLSTGVFYLTLLHRHFDSTSIYQGFPGSRQFFTEVCRASYWSSKHRSGPSVCLIHRTPEKVHTGRIYLRGRAGQSRNILVGFELFSPIGRRIRSLMLYPFGYWTLYSQ